MFVLLGSPAQWLLLKKSFSIAPFPPGLYLISASLPFSRRRAKELYGAEVEHRRKTERRSTVLIEEPWRSGAKGTFLTLFTN
jgi:hypothetical protein